MSRLPLWSALLLTGVMLVGVVSGCVSQQSLPPTPTVVTPISGADLFFGRAPLAGGVPCITCHTLDASGRAGVGPNLAGIGQRGGERIPGVSGREYLERSIRSHDEFIVPGHQAGIVRAVVGDDYGNLLPDEQIAALVDFLLQQQAVEVAGEAVMSAPFLSPTSTPTVSPTLFYTMTATLTLAPTATVTPAFSPTTVATPTMSPLTSATFTPSPQITATASATVAPTLAFTVTPTGVPATATPLLSPTATPSPAPTPTPPPTPTTAPEPTPVPPVASEARLEQFLGCVNCHNLHPQQVRMPHPLNPTCNDCHRGSPSRIGCPTCHSMHQIDNRHEPLPDLPCHACHT
ncbi:c-type cytochrome [uncultured Chloroflexus sp.]|uniref:c-type cytochrome n=1 Tax=uncultured Chloroflexus sp. TaxID=214040 RepID=UPI00263564CC|nr:c-type cytochrome [uncultured Chloroflexus sp.]